MHKLPLMRNRTVTRKAVHKVAVSMLSPFQRSCLLQAAQVRKSAFVPDGDAYNPDKHQSSTLYAGTNVQQVTRP